MFLYKKTWLHTLFWEIKSRFLYILVSFSLCFLISYQHSIPLLYLFVLSYDVKNETLLSFDQLHSFLLKHLFKDSNLPQALEIYDLSTLVQSEKHLDLMTSQHSFFFTKIGEQDLTPLCNFLDSINDSSIRFIFTDVEEAFSSSILICFIFSLISVFPYIVYALLSFLGPSLFLHERQKLVFRIIQFFLFWSFFIITLQNKIIPRLAEFLLKFQIENPGFHVQAETKIYSYCLWASTIFVVANLIFLFVSFLFFYMLNKRIEMHYFVAQRKWCRIVIFLISAFFAPPDIFIQFFLAFILIFSLETLIYFFYIYENVMILKHRNF